MDAFKTAWIESQNFEKAEKLTKAELAEVRTFITELTKKGINSSTIIKRIQKQFPKLAEEYQASRVYWTETKREDTDVIAEAGEDLGIDKYRVILSPHPCQLCIDKTDNGRKIFTQKDIEKTGYGQFVPWHPNCYCVAIPTE
jgi:hypothetical protein